MLLRADQRPFDESATQPSTAYDAVVFDLGGVILSSPFEGIAEYEQQLRVPKGCINGLIRRTGENGSFQRLERGELTASDFEAEFTREAQQAELPGVTGPGFLKTISSLKPRPLMLEALLTLGKLGFKTACLTNNYHDDRSGTSLLEGAAALEGAVDEVVESCKVGMRKPDPRIYEHTCRVLNVDPKRVVYLDDIGANLKPAAALGMTTVKVALADTTGEMALAMLEDILQCELLGRGSDTQATVMPALRPRL